MKKLLVLVAVAEAGTGAGLLVVPTLVGQLLLGSAPDGIAIPIARVTGIALIALSIACWPGPVVLGMLTYSALVTLYFLHLGIQGFWDGPLLWPAMALHAILTLLLARAWWERQVTSSHQQQRNR